ncbi:MAG: heme-binding domain-containing protein [Cyclobacteriaceae bacterium]
MIESKSKKHFNKIEKADTLVVLTGQAKWIIESKCMPCHSNNTMMPEARKRLNLDSINFLPLAKKVARLDDMIYILEKGAMPHQKFMEIRPDGTLSYAERKAIEAWADKTAVRITRPKSTD